jgi:hypothetical protein
MFSYIPIHFQHCRIHLFDEALFGLLNDLRNLLNQKRIVSERSGSLLNNAGFGHLLRKESKSQIFCCLEKVNGNLLFERGYYLRELEEI